MSERRQYICDMCGAIRGEANHWWRAYASTCWLIVPWDQPHDPPYTLWTELHICGQDCATRLLSNFMSKGQQ